MFGKLIFLNNSRNSIKLLPKVSKESLSVSDLIPKKITWVINSVFLKLSEAACAFSFNFQHAVMSLAITKKFSSENWNEQSPSISQALSFALNGNVLNISFLVFDLFQRFFKRT